MRFAAERSRGKPQEIHSPEDPGTWILLVPQTGDGPEFSYALPACPALPPADLDGDGLDEWIVPVEVSAGGTAAWTRIWCVDPARAGSVAVFDVTPDPPCTPPLHPKDSPKPEAVGISPAGIVTVAFTCLPPDDDQAGPGVEVRRSYRYGTGRLRPVRGDRPSVGRDREPPPAG